MSEALGEKDFLSVLRSDQDWFYNGSSQAPAYLDETKSCAEEKTLTIVLLSSDGRSKWFQRPAQVDGKCMLPWAKAQEARARERAKAGCCMVGACSATAATIHRPNAGHNFHPHVNRPHSRPPPPHPAGHKVPAPLLHPSLIFSSSESKQVKERRNCQPHKPGRNLQQATRPPCRLTYFHPTSWYRNNLIRDWCLKYHLVENCSDHFRRMSS